MSIISKVARRSISARVLQVTFVCADDVCLNFRLWQKRGYAAGTAQPQDGIQQGVAYSHLLKRAPEEALRNPELAHISAINGMPI